MRSIISGVIVILTGVILTSCNNSNMSAESGLVTFMSAPASSFSGASVSESNDDNSGVDLTNITELKICVSKIKLDEVEINADLGVIDLSDPNASTTWGELTVPVDVRVLEFKIEAEMEDGNKCQDIGYSMRINGTEIKSPVELTFDFNPPIEMKAGDKINIDLSKMRSKLSELEMENDINDDSVKSGLESDSAKGEVEKSN